MYNIKLFSFGIRNYDYTEVNGKKLFYMVQGEVVGLCIII